MTGTAAVDKEIAILKKKLDTAIASRADVEEDLKRQSSLLSEFIIKLSQVGKGVDKALDNKLAKLRGLFSKSAPIIDIEKLVGEISIQLNQFAQKNDNDIRELQTSFESAGQSLQKVNGLPDDLRRQLRSLLQENQDTKESLSQYIPLLSELVRFYQAALKQGNIAASSKGLLNELKQAPIAQVVESHSGVDSAVIKRFSDFLRKVNVSKKYQEQINKIQSQLSTEMENKQLMDSFLAAFDVISHDLRRERNTAKIFLSTLSETLATVQQAVQSTIVSQKDSKVKLDQLNHRMQSQISDMAVKLDAANSLADVKGDINTRLQAIVKTLEEKTSFEVEQQALFAKQLNTMQEKVNKLEEQSKVFEKRIQEQQAKSLQDALTKLYNRAAFDEHFAREIVRCQNKKVPLALVVTDLDDFKRINDTYGHTAGDKTLQVIANTFSKHIGDDAFVARYGGEEFVFVFTNIEKADLIHKLNLLRKSVAKLPFKFKNNRVSMTLSIGVTHVLDSDNVHQAFERADTALYQAKEKGKNQVIYL